MPHCIFGDAMDKSDVQIFNGSHWEEEIKTKSHIKSYTWQSDLFSTCVKRLGISTVT